MTLHPSFRRPVEFIGLISTTSGSEVAPSSGGPVDPRWVRTISRAHEEGDFDRCLIGYFADAPDGWQTAAFAAQYTERLGFLIAHRPGFVQPTLAARYAATLDHFSQGRVALHIVTGGSEIDQVRDGDHLPKEERYARSGEYMHLLKKTWNEPDTFDFNGRFYQVQDVRQNIRPYQGRDIPLFFGGHTEAALDIGARYADAYAIFGEPLAEVRAFTTEMSRRAAAYGRTLGYSVSLRPIIAATEEAAWERAYSILGTLRERRQRVAASGAGPARGWFQRESAGDNRPLTEGARRLVAAAEQGDVVDERLFVALAKETGAGGNITGPVGTPEQVAATLVQYVEAGATALLIRGFDPLEDAIAYGRDVIPLVRQELAHRARRQAGTLAATGD